MNAIFYKVSDMNNTLDRKLGEGTEIDQIIRGTPWNILQPRFRVKTKFNGQFFPFNYLYLKDFNRYYFITDRNILYNGLIELYCRVDVLKTYKELVKASSAYVTKTTNFNKLVNTGYDSTVEKELEIISLPITLNSEGTNILLANKGGN